MEARFGETPHRGVPVVGRSPGNAKYAIDDLIVRVIEGCGKRFRAAQNGTLMAPCKFV
jgi:hypothetical protein